jgi:hypothetical protein
MSFQPWMQNGMSHPPSFVKIDEGRRNRVKSKLTEASYDGSIKNVIGD